MTAAEAYELTTQGGTSDFARVISACEASGNWCLIGGLAVNTYVEPVYTLEGGDPESGAARPFMPGINFETSRKRTP